MNLSYATDLAPPVADNRLLASLPAGDLEHFCLLLEQIKVIAGDVLCEPGQEITHIYFPGDSLISLLAVAEGRMTLEIGSVGREGMIGAAAALGRNVAQVRAVVQRSGSASRIGRAAFCAQFCKTESLQRLLQRYTDAVLAQAIQIATCSRFHLLEARLARSLLVTRDRLQSGKFYLTHEFLAQTLGVRRVGVTKAASALQQKNLITYSRGHIEIIDAPGLQQASCGCHLMAMEGPFAVMADHFS